MPDQKIIPVIKNKKNTSFRDLLLSVKNTGTKPSQAKIQKLVGGKDKINNIAERTQSMKSFILAALRLPANDLVAGLGGLVT